MTLGVRQSRHRDGVAQLLFVSTTHPMWFVVFRFLEGVGVAAVSPAALAFVADLSTEKDRSRAYGWMTSAQFGGLVAGPVISWPLYTLGGGSGLWAFYAIFLFGSALSFLTTIAVFFVVREPRKAHGREAVRVKHPPYRKLVTKPILAFLIVAATGHLAMGFFEVLWSLYLHNLGASLHFISLTFTAFSVPMLLSFFGGYLADRYSRFALWVSGSTVAAFAWIYYGVTDNLTIFLVVSIIEGLAFAWSSPARQAFLVLVAPRRWLGSVQGLEQTSMQVAAMIGTLVAPVLYEYISGTVISIGGVVSLIGLAVAARILYPVWKRLKAGEEVADQRVEEAVEILR